MLSIVVPVLNEEESLGELHAQIAATCDTHEIEWELVLVDDGSTDRSWSVITSLAQDHQAVSGIRLRRNFGKAAALTAGMQAATGELVMMMDADLQDDPAEIPGLIQRLDEGFDVVNGWKKHRLDPWHKVFPSKVFNSMIGRLTGLKLHDHNCGLKLFRREVTQEVTIYGELHRFIPVMAHARGFRVTEQPVNHRPRQHGHSKYGVRRFLRGFLDLLTVKFLTGYGQRPGHILGAVGLLFLGLGTLGLGFLGCLWIYWKARGQDPGIGANHLPMLVYSAASLLLGGQALSLGLLAELLVSRTANADDTFSVAEQVGGPPARPLTPSEEPGPNSIGP